MKRAIPAIIFVIPTFGAALLWLASGREGLTKSGKNVPVEVADDLFGGTNAASRWQPGPILGYHVGFIDAVLPVAGAAALLAAAVWWFQRRAAARRRPLGDA